MNAAILSSRTTYLQVQARYPQIRLGHASEAIRTEGIIRRTSIHAFLIAPGDLQDSDLPHVCSVLDFRTLPLVILGKLNHLGASLVEALSRTENPRLHLDLFDDATTLTDFICEITPCREQLRYRHEIRERTDKLSRRLGNSIYQAMKEYPAPCWVRRTAHSAGCSERQFRNAVKRCGIRDPKFIPWGARVLDACGFGKDPAFSDANIAHKCGYSASPALRDSLHHINVTSLRDLAELSGDACLERVLETTLS